MAKASSEDDPLEIETYGPSVCGMELMVIDGGRKTFSFLLTGTRGGIYLYECVFAG